MTLVFAGDVAEAFVKQVLEISNEQVLRITENDANRFTEQQHKFNQVSASIPPHLSKASMTNLFNTAMVASTLSVWLPVDALAVVFRVSNGSVFSFDFPPVAVPGLIGDIRHYFKDAEYSEARRTTKADAGRPRPGKG